MKSFYDKEEYSIEDIQSLIDNQVEESIYLDFKAEGAFAKTDGKKKEISKDISAFANSEGGIIIYGLSEKDHKADSFSFIDGNEFTKEWIEHVINSSIQRRIDNIQIIPIRENNDLSKTIYLVKIPKSLDAPHLSKEKRFYKRFNFESVQMEEYEIRQSYGRKLKSSLIIDAWNLTEEKDEGVIKFGDRNFVKFIFEVEIYNNGEVSEENYKVNAIFKNLCLGTNINWHISRTNQDYTSLGKGSVKISANSIMPIFQRETLNVLRVNLEVPEIQMEELKNIVVEITLFYSGGEDFFKSDFAKVSERYYLQNNK